ncbi:hypothetical protein SAY86_021995 [Trapa natans]|uniref:Uncharacterized protein n=1 Tax=Trapa natans TaxID=22666 RepID=A0AAN7M2X4_TRANT|nr:hypothetical protein SAY86_021995 [Trapa natans]
MNRQFTAVSAAGFSSICTGLISAAVTAADLRESSPLEAEEGLRPCSLVARLFAASKLLAVDRGRFRPELLHVSDVLKSSNGESPSNAWVSDYLVHFRPSLGGMSSARAGTGHRPSHLLMVEISLQATIGQLAEIPALQRAVDQRPCLVATLAIVIDLEARSEND